MPAVSEPISYDEVPYPGAALAETHPSNLAVIGTLFGLRPASPSRCRVLELGCATGGNLLPMAELLPESSFTGVDLSGVQIGMARVRARQLGLKNVRFEEMSILDVGADFGEFDYIICYGVYSWVPADVREKILRICGDHLAPDGIAAVSFNTYPGWHFRGLARDMFVYHSRGLGSTDERIDSSLALLQFAKEATAGMGEKYSEFRLYSQVLEREMKLLTGRARHYFVHEHLEGVNEPCYLHEFASRAAAHGLSFLGDVRLSTMSDGILPPEVIQQLSGIAPDFTAMEQYKDFFTNRTFRNTLLSRQERKITRDLSGESMFPLAFSSSANPVREDDAAYDENVPKLRSHRGGAVVTMNSVLSFFALGYLLEQSPRWIPFDALLAETRRQLAEAGETPGDEADDARRLGETLLRCLSAEVVDATFEPPSIANEIGERPRASGYARLQAEADQTATNLRHESFAASSMALFVLPRLDGAHTRTDLIAIVDAAIGSGKVTIEDSGLAAEEQAAAFVDAALEELRLAGALMGWEGQASEAGMAPSLPGTPARAE